jgi:hypothetical protein
MLTDNRAYLKDLEQEWYDALIYKKDGESPTAEQIDRTQKNSRRNAKRTLHRILKDRLLMLATLPEVPAVIQARKITESQLKEIEQFVKPRQEWDIHQSSKHTTYKRN